MRFERSISALSVLVIIISGCLSGPLPEDIVQTPSPTTPAPPALEDINYLSFNSLAVPEKDPVVENVTPEINGMILLPVFNPVDVVSNDLSVLNHPRRLQLLAQVLSTHSFIYLKPARETDTLIYLTIYRLNDSQSAQEILEAYKGQWNKRQFTSSGGDIWIWDGYLDELEGRSTPFNKNTVLYWNPESEEAFVQDRVLKDHPALSRPQGTLYSVHGETSSGPYFIMVDIKTVLPDILNRTNSIFSQALDSIFKNQTPGGIAQPPLLNETVESIANESIDSATQRIKESLRNLLDSYLAGNISKEEYESQFENYSFELVSLENKT
jgi:hypothetical protein